MLRVCTNGAFSRGHTDARENPEKRLYAGWRTQKIILAISDTYSIITRMFNRTIAAELALELDHNPAVALLGPRQVGKTTLALAVAQSRPAVYLDLESERDRAKLDNAELYLTDHLDKLVILDEVHRAPALFPLLRLPVPRSVRQKTKSLPVPELYRTIFA